jgi:hypothetical protein
MGIQDEFEIREQKDKLQNDLLEIRNYKEVVNA